VVLTRSLAQTEADDALIVDSLLDEVNAGMRRRRLLTRLVALAVVLLVAVLPLMTEKLSNESKIVCLIVAGLIAGIFAYFQITDKPVGIETNILNWGRTRLQYLADIRGIRSKLDKTQIEQFGKQLKRSAPLRLD
jgi:hypothetical protein